MNATNRTMNGTRHAEFMAINEILSTPAVLPQNSNEKDVSAEENRQCKRKYGPEILKDCDLYVTVEPCIMCASLLRQFGIRKVYYGATNEKFGGTGGVLNIHRANGAPVKESEERKVVDGDYEVSGGWLREEAIILLRRFYVQENGKGEFLILFVYYICQGQFSWEFKCIYDGAIPLTRYQHLNRRRGKTER